MAIIVTSLPDYVEQNRMPLIGKSLLGSKSASILTSQSGIKGDTALNLIDTEVVFQDGSDCGWNAAGSTTLSQRTFDPAVLKVNTNFCHKKLLGKYAEHQVRITAGKENLPFEEKFMEGVADGINEGIEKMIWQGDSTNDNEFDGLLKVMGDASVSGSTLAKGTSAYAAIKDAYMALPERVATKADTVVLVSDGMFRSYIQDLVSANLYHFNPATSEAGEYEIPGTKVKVIAVSGLNDTATYDYVVAGRLSNMFYGYDFEDDKDAMDMWFSKDNQEFRLAVNFIGSTQVAYPDELVLNKVTK